MKHPLLRMFALTLLVSVLAGCATTERPRGTVSWSPSRDSITAQESLQRVHDQVYQAATGSGHVGSTYTP